MERKNKFVISSWLIYIFLVLGMWLCVQPTLEPDFFFNFHSLENMVPLFIAMIFVILLYFFIERKRNKRKANFVLLVSLACFFIFFLVVILLIPESRELAGTRYIRGPSGYTEEIVSGTFIITVENRVYYILFTAVSLFTTYAILVLLPKGIYVKRIIYLLYFLMLTYTLICFIYSLVVEMDEYINFFLTFIDKAMNVHPVPDSFLGNRNFLGWVYFFTLAYTLVMHAYTKKWYYYLIGSIVFLISVPILSKTNILSSGILILSYLLYRFIVSVKKHPVRNIITFILTFGIVLWFTLSIVFSFTLPKENGYLTFFKKLALTAVGFDEDLMEPTFTNRTILWRIWFRLMNEGNYWLTGAGYGYFNLLYQNYATMCLGGNTGVYDMPHNGFMQILGEGGV